MSPMHQRLLRNQDLRGGGGSISNVSTAIEKQGLERGFAPCAQKWKTSNIGKRKPEWMMDADMNFQDGVAPQPPGSD